MVFNRLRVSQKVVTHLILWGLFSTILLLRFFLDFRAISYGFFLRGSIIIGVFYINYALLVPFLLLKKKIKIYLCCALILIGAAMFLFQQIPVSIYYEQHRLFIKPKFFGARKHGMLFIINVVFIVVGTAIKLYEEWYKNEQNKKEMRAQKIEAEIQILRNQLNPHFLFNSLNSIYSLTRKQSLEAPEAVITLSELMRYMLYQANKDLVLLKEEMEYIQSYFKLQLLRVAKSELVSINIRGDIKDQKIRPLLLVSFIENAFKYGTDFEGNTEVKIVVNICENNLEFKCVNLIGNTAVHGRTHGIGINNTKGRLDLLYPDKHKLEISNEDGKYIVVLKLDLSETS